ncbi:MAG TPA: hypothetical protein VIY53_03085 [Acidobacteriaceae bacterium]
MRPAFGPNNKSSREPKDLHFDAIAHPPDRITPDRIIPGRITPDRITPGRIIPGRIIPDRFIPGRSTPPRRPDETHRAFPVSE